MMGIYSKQLLLFGREKMRRYLLLAQRRDSTRGSWGEESGNEEKYRMK